MSITSHSAKELAQLGVNLEITDGSGFTSHSVKEIIQIATAKGNHVTVHAGAFTPQTLKEMALIGKANITIRI